MPFFMMIDHRRWLLWLAVLAVAGVWIGGTLLALWLPQRPDGDLTAIALFDAQHGHSAWHMLRDAWWLNAAGAALIGLLLAALLLSNERRQGRHLLLLGLMLWMGGWLWNQTRGWQGVLYLEPGVETPLGVDGRPLVTFERFLQPPTASGPGRALRLRLNVDGRWRDIDRTRPYRVLGWTLRPLWYGATVSSPELRVPLFFGQSGTQSAELGRGGAVRVTLDLSTLAMGTDPPLRAISADHHAILAARFAPAAWVQWLGVIVSGIGGGLSLWAWGQRQVKGNGNE